MDKEDVAYICIYIYTQCNIMSYKKELRLSVIPWTVPCQTPLSVEFSRQEYWSELPFLSPGDLPNPQIEPESPVSPALQAVSLSVELWFII